MLQQGSAFSVHTVVDNEFNVSHVLDQHAPLSRYGPPFCPRSETNAHSPTVTSNSNYEQQISPMTSKSAANQTRRTSISSKDNDRLGSLLAANMPFPEATYLGNLHQDNDPRMHDIGRAMLANKLERKRNPAAASLRVNLQNKVRITPKFSPAANNQNDSAGGDGSITQLGEGESHSGDELHHIIQACVEKRKQKLHEQIQLQDAKISEISKKNEDYKEIICELRATNSSLSEKLKIIKEGADALNERVKLQAEECKSLGEIVANHKSDTAEYRQEAENMRTSLMEAKNGLEGLQLYQQNSKVGLEEAKALAIGRKLTLWYFKLLLIWVAEIRSFNSLKEDLDMYKVKLQQERDKLRLLQKELQAQRQEGDLKDTIKGFLESHYLGVTDRLAIQESKLSEAISNSDRENQSKLSDCLGLLESMIGKSQEAPKEVLEMRGLLETLSSNIGDRLQSADDGSEALRNAGTEVMEALKSRIDTLFEIQDAKRELEERISCLQVSNARLEVASRGHEERIRELQTQLIAKESELDRCRAESNFKSEWNESQVNDMQKQLDKCREDLATKDSELRRAQAKIEVGSGSRNELTILQAIQAKTASGLADTTKALRDCQTAFVDQGNSASAMQVQNTDLAERLTFAEQKTLDVERKLLQLKESTSESLERQRVEAETERRRSLESEKRSHAQKVSNLQHQRVEAEEMVEGLKVDVKKKEQLILALETEKATLEGENKEQAQRLAELDQESISHVAEYQSLAEALKSTAVDIAHLERKLALNEENAAADSLIVNKINECVEAVIRENAAVKTRLEAYERIEAKVQDYCQKSGISVEANAIGDILEILAGSRGQTSVVARIASQNHVADNRTATLHPSKGKGTTFPQKVVRPQIPNSPEILDSQMPSAPSSSPLPRRGVRSIAPQSGPRVGNGTPSNKGSFGPPSRKLEVEDSQEIRGKLTRSPSYSSLSELDSDEFSQINDCYIVASDRLENKQGRREETDRGKRHTAALNKADGTSSIAQAPKPTPKIQANTSLKSCLKQTRPKSNSVDEKSMSDDIVKTTPSDSTLMKSSTSRQGRKTRLASISGAHDPSKKLPFNDNRTGHGDTPRLVPKQSLTSMRSGGSVSQTNIHKRTMASVSGGMKSESPTKRLRLSLPGRDFQPVSLFVPEVIKRRDSSIPYLES